MPKLWPTFLRITRLRRDVYVSDLSLSEPVRLTDANPWIREDRTLTQGEVLQWEGKGGMLIEGIYYPPVRKGRSSGKDPLIVFIHGGPPAAWEANFRDDFQIMTNAGYAILAPNPRGSQGYGEEFLQALRGEVGDGEFIDMMNGVDHVIANKKRRSRPARCQRLELGWCRHQLHGYTNTTLQSRIYRCDGWQLGSGDWTRIQL